MTSPPTPYRLPATDNRLSPWVLGMAALVAGVLLGAFLALRFSPSHTVALRPHPFGLEAGKAVERGANFEDRAAVQNLPDSLRGRYLAAEAAQDSGSAAPVWANLPEADFPGARTRAVLAQCGWKPGEDDLVPTPGAVAALESALAKWPDQPLLLHVRGRIFEAQGRAAQAESSYARAVRVAPQFAYPYVRLGRLHAQGGAWLRAGEEYRAALSLWATDPGAYSGKHGAAPALEIPPYAGLARQFYERGHTDSAAWVLEYARQERVEDSEVDFIAGLIAEERGDLRSADSTYRALAARRPGDIRFVDAAATLGVKPPRGALVPSSKATAVFAISVLEPMVQRFPRNAPLRLALGQAYLHRGLNGLAVASLDSALRLDSGLAEARPLHEAAYRRWMEERTSRPAVDSLPVAKVSRPARDSGEDGAVRVIVPGSTGLLGAYTVGWGATPGEVRRAYPGKVFTTLPNGNLRETFAEEGVVHDYVLAFKQGELWGVFVLVTDTAGNSGDLLGRLLRLKSKISGEGRGTGETTCAGGKKFQGAIWENDDTFEFLAQFHGREKEIRLARLAYAKLPQNRRVCDLEVFLEPKTWK